MSQIPMHEILERLSAQYGKPAALIRYEMELYLEEMMQEDTEEVRRIRAIFQGRKVTVEDYLGLMAEQMWLDKEKRE